MRDLFRGKNAEKETEEWIYGYYVVYGKIQHVIIKDGEYGKNIAYEVHKNTICRCTGVEDKNRINIFEHDIVSVPMSNHLGKKQNEIGVVEWLNGAFHVKWTNEKYGRHFVGYLYDVEVIGNIFDNPELIGE